MIRFATEKDLPAMLAIYKPYVEETTYSFEYDVPCLRTFTQRFYDHVAQFPWLVWEEDGAVLGYAYAGAPWERAAYRWCAEVSIYLHPSIHGKGIGRQLYHALEEQLQTQGYIVLYALVTSANEASCRFHEALGYRVLAHFPGCAYKMGRQLGVTWMEKILISAEMPSNFPKPFPSFVENIENFTKILDILSVS